MANIYNAQIKRTGRVEPTGQGYNARGTLVGVVAPDGQISTLNAQLV